MNKREVVRSVENLVARDTRILVLSSEIRLAQADDNNLLVFQGYSNEESGGMNGEGANFIFEKESDGRLG